MNANAIDRIINETKRKETTSNFTVLAVIISLLAIDFFPYFKSLEIINPQFLYLSVINLILGFYFYFNSDITSATVFPILKRSYIFKLYLAFIVLCGISIFTAKNTSLVYTKFTEIVIVFCLFINLTILLKDKLDLLYKIILIVGISSFFQAWEQLAHFIVIPRHASIIDLLNAMKGNTGNINILAASLTIKVPFLLLGITHYKGYKKWFLLAALFSVTAVIFLTGARTPLINLFLIYFIYIIYLLKDSFSRLSFVKIIYLIIPVLIAILFANSIFEKSKDIGRYVSLENRVSQINTKDASSQARLTFWGNVIKMGKKSPILGIGLGNYQVESIPYERTTSNDSNVSLHAHNDFLEILAETGILNGLIYFSLFVLLFIINLNNVIKTKDSTIKLFALLTLMLVVVYGVDSIFNFPMYRPTMAIFFALFLAFTVLINCNNTNLGRIKTVKIISAILISVSLATSYSAYLIYKASNLEYLIATDNINMNEKGVLTGDEVINRMPKYPNTFSSSEAFYEYAGIYYVREKNYEKAFKCFAKASKINPYSGRIDFYKQLISSQKGNIDSAYIYSKRAFYLRPRNYALFKAAMNFAILKRDTIEIIKQHNLYTKYRNEPDAWALSARGLQNSGANYKRVINFIDQGLKVLPNDSTLLKQKNSSLVTNYIVEGQVFGEQGKRDKELELYQKALKIDSQNIYVLQNIGFCYYNTGKNDLAIKFFKKTLEYPGSDNGRIEYYIGICYLNLNDKVNADKYFQLSKNKNYVSAKQSNSIALNGNEQAVFEKRKNDLLIAYYITEGQKFEERKKMDQALLSFKKALKIDSKSIYAAQNIGFHYLKIGEYKKGISFLLDALKYPGLNDGKTEYFLAICYLNENDKSNACKYFNIAKNKNYATSQQAINENCMK
ncbi:O-antigen ligase family protein [Flavobacterium tyrosinilyticum]|uniref:O-antigen ligase family protein n=1 Tax=Flavobacterium tyrosinilyticum TaxID=1658740 RepID=UPI0020305949|nr:O-antigen ligase family protein [Flavobacterium tyrosinilyticum]MCM0667227.1 O-antigen ligase family protein [Flavobacterium tyrosinilyticum]